MKDMGLLPTLAEDAGEMQPDKGDSSKVAQEVVAPRSVEKREGSPLIDDTGTHGINGDHRDTNEKDSKRKKRERGQNKGRKIANTREDVRLCPRVTQGLVCKRPVGECRFEHDLALYMQQKPLDIGTECAVYQTNGSCNAGFKCRWLSGHVDRQDPSDPKTWRLTYDHGHNDEEEDEDKISSPSQNVGTKSLMIALRKRQYSTPRSDAYLSYLEKLTDAQGVEVSDAPDVPLRAVEKRRLNWSGAKVLAPLTTTGNLPFRQICREFGADVTYSEMAVSAPLLQGNASEWALTKSHAVERDLRNGRKGMYGIQIAGPKPGINMRAAEVLSKEFSSTLDFIDLNCGCPIDLIYKSGAGSALLDNQGKLMKILKGMSMVSGEVPITCKLRTGVSDKKHTAGKLLARLNADACVSMVTLHGRSRQQRYSRSADWGYIAQCAADIKSYQAQLDQEDLRGAHGEFGYDTRMAFMGNGDVYSFEDWNAHLDVGGVDGCMIARGALIKPWIFEEITAQQHIDKSASERMEMLHTYCKNGLSHWGSDQMGIDKTRRFMLEFMSFHHRYTPLGLLENQQPLPMNERAPSNLAYRSEDERLLASEDCGDWIKISERFLGKASEQFKFIPKHKANASTEAEG